MGHGATHRGTEKDQCAKNAALGKDAEIQANPGVAQQTDILDHRKPSS